MSNVVITTSAPKYSTSWEISAIGLGFTNPRPGNGPFQETVEGWGVDSGDVDVWAMGGGNVVWPFCPSHTGTHSLELNGFIPGSIWTNVATVPGKTYLLSFVYTKNPNVQTPAFQPTARVEFNKQGVTNIFYNGPSDYCTLNWSNCAITYRATSSVTRVGFVSTWTANSIAGIYLDTIRMDEVEITTNSLLYATFTDDTLKAFEPIKFAPPPFGDTTFVGTNKFISGFEGTKAATFPTR